MTPESIYKILQAGKAKKRGRPVKPSFDFNRKFEIIYTKELLSISAQCKQEGAEILEIMRSSGQFSDSVNVGDVAIGDAPSWLNRITNISRSGVSSKVQSFSAKLASKVVYGQQAAADDKLAIKIKNITSIEIRDFLTNDSDFIDAIENAISANVDLIESIPVQYHEKLKSKIFYAAQTSKDLDWLEAEIKKLGEITDRRARRIARDQMSTVNAKINETRQRSLGIEKYIWVTCNDERVRGSHFARHKSRFSWDNPPRDGHPGEPIECRCGAHPYIE